MATSHGSSSFNSFLCCCKTAHFYINLIFAFSKIFSNFCKKLHTQIFLCLIVCLYTSCKKCRNVFSKFFITSENVENFLFYNSICPRAYLMGIKSLLCFRGTIVCTYLSVSFSMAKVPSLLSRVVLSSSLRLVHSTPDGCTLLIRVSG